jgi:hypothetical protein
MKRYIISLVLLGIVNGLFCSDEPVTSSRWQLSKEKWASLSPEERAVLEEKWQKETPSGPLSMEAR